MRRLLESSPFRLYLLGLACIFAGAWGMAKTNSMVPMALASSAGLMLTVPIVRHLLRRRLRPAAIRRQR